MKKLLVVVLAASVLLLMAACSSQQELKADAPAPAANGHAETSPAKDAENEPVSITPNSPQASPEIAPIYDEQNIRYISSISDRERTFDTLDELNQIADTVITGVCVSSEPVFQNNLIYTASEVKIDNVFRGVDLSAGDTIIVIEMGGRTTYGEYEKNCPREKKAFDTGEPMPSDYRLIEGTDGYFPLKENENVLLFLTDATGFIQSIKQPAYSIWGDYDGKLFLQPDGITYARPLPSKNDTLQFGKGTLSITTDELKEKVN